jgi:Tfp pilus assembly protein PilF
MVAESLLARAAALSARQTDDLDRQMVEIYRRNAQSQQATAVYERLVQRHPRDARLVRDFATFLLSQSREDATRRGLQLLQSLDRVHPAGSLDWFENRLAMAESLTRLEKWGEAEKLLKKTRLLYPKLGTAEQRTRADSLLRQAQAAGPEKRPG